METNLIYFDWRRWIEIDFFVWCNADNCKLAGSLGAPRQLFLYPIILFLQFAVVLL